MKIHINNKWVEEKNANISIFTPEFMYGFGVFETIRTYNKNPLKLKEHIDRLYSSAAIIGLNMKYTKKQVLTMTKKVIASSKHKSQRVKIVGTPHKLIITSEKLSYKKRIYKGVKTISYSGTRELHKAKTLSFLTSYLAHQKALSKDAYEAILIDNNNILTEGAYSNIFWFENQNLCSNMKKSLNGITAQTVIQLSPYKFQEKTITLKELKKKKEIFLTQTTKGIVPIIKIDKTVINSGQVEEKTAKLISLFDDFVKKTTAPSPNQINDNK